MRTGGETWITAVIVLLFVGFHVFAGRIGAAIRGAIGTGPIGCRPRAAEHERRNTC